MLKEIVENLSEGKKFHPIDVFGDRWLVTDGKSIIGTTGEVRTHRQFKQDMQKSKIYNEWDYIYFPTEQMAKDALSELGSNFKKFKVERTSYNG